MTNTNVDEQRQKWTWALRLQMGMPEQGTGTDAVRWLAIGVPDDQCAVRLGKMAVESRVDLVTAMFVGAADCEPIGFGIVFRTLAGAMFGAGIPVVFGKDEPISLYSPATQCLFALDERGILSKRCGERVNGLQLAHKRAMKRLRRAVSAIDLGHVAAEWHELEPDTAAIPLSKVSKFVVQAA